MLPALATVETFKNQIVCTDALTLLRSLPPQSVDMVLTSPPYDPEIRNIWSGFDWTPYPDALLRVLRPGGVCVWQVADATVNGSETLSSFRQAIGFVEAGFKLWDTMIYNKFAGNVNQHHPRYLDSFEYMFIFLAGEKPHAFNPVMRKTVSTGQKRTATKKMQRNGKHSYYGRLRTVSQNVIESNVWTLATGVASGDHPLAFKHPAPMQQEIARRHIYTWSNPGGIVFDPFMGSGTTACVALQLGRNYIGSEINPEYVELARRRLATVDPFQHTPLPDGGKQLSLFAGVA